jgi:hypothetical protein
LSGWLVMANVSVSAFILLKYSIVERPPFFKVANCTLVFMDLARDAPE